MIFNGDLMGIWWGFDVNWWIVFMVIQWRSKGIWRDVNWDLMAMGNFRVNGNVNGTIVVYKQHESFPPILNTSQKLWFSSGMTLVWVGPKNIAMKINRTHMTSPTEKHDSTSQNVSLCNHKVSWWGVWPQDDRDWGSHRCLSSCLGNWKRIDTIYILSRSI